MYQLHQRQTYASAGEEEAMRNEYIEERKRGCTDAELLRASAKIYEKTLISSSVN